MAEANMDLTESTPSTRTTRFLCVVDAPTNALPVGTVLVAHCCVGTLWVMMLPFRVSFVRI